MRTRCARPLPGPPNGTRCVPSENAALGRHSGRRRGVLCLQQFAIAPSRGLRRRNPCIGKAPEQTSPWRQKMRNVKWLRRSDARWYRRAGCVETMDYAATRRRRTSYGSFRLWRYRLLRSAEPTPNRATIRPAPSRDYQPAPQVVTQTRYVPVPVPVATPRATARTTIIGAAVSSRRSPSVVDRPRPSTPAPAPAGEQPPAVVRRHNAGNSNDRGERQLARSRRRPAQLDRRG